MIFIYIFDIDGSHFRLWSNGALVLTRASIRARNETKNLTKTYLRSFNFRMGSFNSAPKIQNADTQDDCVEVPQHLANSIDLVDHCRVMRGESLPQLLPRSFYTARQSVAILSADVTDGLRLLELNSVSKSELNSWSEHDHQRVTALIAICL